MAMGDFPDSFNVIVNANHSLVSDILKSKDESLAKQSFDLALLGVGMLRGESLTAFIGRSLDILKPKAKPKAKKAAKKAE